MNILLTSAGRRSYLVEYFRQALAGDGKVLAANSEEGAPAMLVADGAVKTPLIYDPSYIPFLLDYCRKEQVTAVIPLFDIDVPVLSAHKKEFADIGVTVIAADTEAARVCNDKWQTFRFLKHHQIRTPRTEIKREAALENLRSGSWEWPVIIKPRWGMGSLGIYEAQDEEELTVLSRIAKRKVENSYMKYESKNSPDECILFQEKLPGTEYGLDVINDLQGRYCNTIVKEKYGMRSGETDCARTEDREDLKNLGRKLAGLIGQPGNLDVDAFLVNGEPYVLEMNARFGGGYPFSHQAGVNLPLAIVKWLKGEDVDPAILQAESGICCHKGIQMMRL